MLGNDEQTSNFSRNLAKFFTDFVIPFRHDFLALRADLKSDVQVAERELEYGKRVVPVGNSSGPARIASSLN
jgi:hypothetical protein